MLLASFPNFFPLFTNDTFFYVIFSLESNSTILPYGIEKAYDISGNLYYLSHTTQQTFRELPDEETLDTRTKRSRKFKEVIIARLVSGEVHVKLSSRYNNIHQI